MDETLSGHETPFTPSDVNSSDARVSDTQEYSRRQG